MDELIARALDLAKVKGAEYADIRFVHTEQERYVVRNGAVDTLSMDESMGFGVRVVAGGGWGFASSHEFSGPEVDRVTALAVRIAKASTLLAPNAERGAGGISLGAPVTSRGTYSTPIQVDPFKVSTDDKLALLLEVDRRMASVRGITSRQSNLVFIKEHKTFANTEGAHVQQTIYDSGGGMQASAVGHGEVRAPVLPGVPWPPAGMRRVGVYPRHGPGRKRRTDRQRGCRFTYRRSLSQRHYNHRHHWWLPTGPSGYTSRAAMLLS